MLVLEKAHAKINLFLDVLGKRSDGYHEVNMVMQTLELADEIELSPSARLVLETDCEQLPVDEGNIAFRAAELMAKEAGRPASVKINIKKRIPLAAGLAGGSSDAAAVLRGLNGLWQLGWPVEKLKDLAAELGSDVPFCITGGTALATGRGEKIEQLPDCPEMTVVLACPDIEVSTAWVYRNFSRGLVLDPPDIEETLAAIGGEDIRRLADSLHNVLELVTIKEYPMIQDIKIAMLGAGSSACLMSGSGPSVFALAAGEEQANLMAEKVQKATGARVWITRTRRPQWKI